MKEYPIQNRYFSISKLFQVALKEAVHFYIERIMSRSRKSGKAECFEGKRSQRQVCVKTSASFDGNVGEFRVY